jgi:hypothetical protein
MKYHYFSNWDGAKHRFNTLREAKKAASKDEGVSQTIYNSLTGRIAACVRASGHVPA